MELIGRSSSHFTRLVRIVAHELAVELPLVPLFDMTATNPDVFAGNPALKIPVLRRSDGALVFGAENICRVVAEHAGRERAVVWPEELRSDVNRNAQELVWHAMSAQVQLVMGTAVGKLPADNVFFTKLRAGLEGALGWLDTHLDATLRGLPGRRLSLFEVALFCLVEHLQFRPTVPLEAYGQLRAFAREFAERPSARATPYKFDSQ